jgi:tetratricopeptide (TPR) repeat protein
MDRKQRQNAGNPSAAAGAGGNDNVLQEALFALNRHDPREAERIAGEVLRTTPYNARALHIFGCALLMQGHAEAAITPLETAARGRHDPEIETQLAMALRQCGRHEDALAQLRRASKRRPPYAPAFLELGAMLVSAERYDEAIEVLCRGVEIAPMTPQLSIQLGYAYLNRKDSAHAKAAFAKALEIAPSSADALFGMAKAHRDAGEARQAADHFRRYLAGRPDDYVGWIHLGHCLLDLGQLDAGYESFRNAARADPRGYASSLSSLATSRRGRFWLKPSAAERFFRGTNS